MCLVSFDSSTWGKRKVTKVIFTSREPRPKEVKQLPQGQWLLREELAHVVDFLSRARLLHPHSKLAHGVKGMVFSVVYKEDFGSGVPWLSFDFYC